MIRRGMKAAIMAALTVGVVPSIAVAQEEQAPSVEAPSDVELALAKQIIDLGFPEDTRETLFFGAMDQMMIQTREATLKAYQLEDEGAIAVLDQWTVDYMEENKEVLRSHIPSLMQGMVASYAVIFTRKELEDILAFVSTPSGQRFFELSPAVMAEPNFALANQAYMNEIQANLPEAMEDLFGRLQEYLIERQEAEEQLTS